MKITQGAFHKKDCLCNFCWAAIPQTQWLNKIENMSVEQVQEMNRLERFSK